MRKSILFIPIVLTAVYAFIVIAVNHDNRWFQEFSESVQSDSITNKYRKLTEPELVHGYKGLHNQSVEVEGYLNYEFENVSLCTNFENQVIGNSCFWLEVEPNPRDMVDSFAKILRNLSGSKVRLNGIIDTGSKGHKGMFLATISHIGDIQPIKSK